jgi:hypothetical protein
MAIPEGRVKTVCPCLLRRLTLDAMRGLPGWSGQSLKQGG